MKQELKSVNHYQKIVDETLGDIPINDDLLSLLDSKINFLNEHEQKLNRKIALLTISVDQKKQVSKKHIAEA